MPLLHGVSLQDGIVDLSTAKVDRLNNDVVEDLTRLMDSIEGEDKKLGFEQFVKLMLAAEVPFLITSLIYCQSPVARLLWFIRSTKWRLLNLRPSIYVRKVAKNRSQVWVL